MAAVALSVLLLQSFVLDASSASGELCSVLLQTQTAQSSLAELDDFESSLDDLQTVTQELATHRSSSRRRASSLQMTSAQDEEFETAYEDRQIVVASLLRNATTSNASTDSASDNATWFTGNLSNLSATAQEIAQQITAKWNRVWTAAAVVAGVQILLFVSLYFGGKALFGEYRFLVLKIGCLYTSLPLMIYWFYEIGALGQTFSAAVPFMVAFAILATFLIPLLIECALELHAGWMNFADELSFVIKLQRKIASKLQISLDVVDEDGDGDVDCADYMHHLRKNASCC